LPLLQAYRKYGSSIFLEKTPQKIKAGRNIISKLESGDTKAIIKDYRGAKKYGLVNIPEEDIKDLKPDVWAPVFQSFVEQLNLVFDTIERNFEIINQGGLSGIGNSRKAAGQCL
jgi:hypothetical protein